MAAQQISFDHPTQETFERLLLNRIEQVELDTVEPHLMICDSCLTRVEGLELQIRTTKIALENIEWKQVTKAAARKRATRSDWFRLSALSRAGLSSAAIVGALLLIVQSSNHKAPVPAVNLSANRDSETAFLPEGRSVRLTLNAVDLPNGPVGVAIINNFGSEIWKGNAAVLGERVEISLPSVKESGMYVLRLDAPWMSGRRPEVLKEFTFYVR